MATKKNRTTVPFNLQIDAEVAAHVRQFADERGEKIRHVVELALKRHLANPPPQLQVPPLPPLMMSGDSAPKKSGPRKQS